MKFIDILHLDLIYSLFGFSLFESKVFKVDIKRMSATGIFLKEHFETYT
jgi:hypothetical protein